VTACFLQLWKRRSADMAAGWFRCAMHAARWPFRASRLMLAHACLRWANSRNGSADVTPAMPHGRLRYGIHARFGAGRCASAGVDSRGPAVDSVLIAGHVGGAWTCARDRGMGAEASGYTLTDGHAVAFHHPADHLALSCQRVGGQLQAQESHRTLAPLHRDDPGSTANGS
jgi:hypothetical protein